MVITANRSDVSEVHPLRRATTRRRPDPKPTTTATTIATPRSVMDSVNQSSGPAPTSETTMARNRVTRGVASPSLSPLSTLRARRIRPGTERSENTPSPRAASVGARMLATSAAAAQVRPGTSHAAVSVPAMTVSGKPMRSNRAGRPGSSRRSFQRKVAASAKSRTARVTSVTTFATSVSRETSNIPRPAGPISAPAATKTIGAVIDHRSKRPATSE